MDTIVLDQRVLIVAASAIACVAVVVLWRLTRRQAPVVSRTRPVLTAPYLESPDGRVRLPLNGLDASGLTIGCGSGADLVVSGDWPNADTISERHVRVYQDTATGNVMIEDLNSTQGVFINGRRAPHKNILRDRWTVGLGGLTLVYRDGHSDTGPVE